MSFQVIALPDTTFERLQGLSDVELEQQGIRAYIADKKPGFPCRVSLRDADVGARMFLLNYEHQTAGTPYRSSHAIYVQEGASTAEIDADVVPEVLRSRLLSIRAFDTVGMMIESDVVDGTKAADTFERMFANERAVYLHVHNAKPGCYAAKVERAATK